MCPMSMYQIQFREKYGWMCGWHDFVDDATQNRDLITKVAGLFHIYDHGR